MSDLPKPISRKEGFLSALSGEEIPLPKPIDREEQFLATMAGATGIELPNPISRKEIFYNAIIENGGVTPGPGPGPQPTPTPTLPEISDVNFWDYDGTVVAKYTAAEFMRLTEFPANPNHTDKGLVSQGWNWTMADAKAFVMTNGMLDIGQLYDTDDGSTRVVIELDEDNLSIGFNIHMSTATGQDRATINWGDGTTSEASGSIASYTYPHTYAAPGKYTITITGGYAYLGGSSTYWAGLISAPNIELRYENRVMNRVLRELYIGSNWHGVQQFGNSTFPIFGGAINCKKLTTNKDLTFAQTSSFHVNTYENSSFSFTEPYSAENVGIIDGPVLVKGPSVNYVNVMSSDFCRVVCPNKDDYLYGRTFTSGAGMQQTIHPYSQFGTNTYYYRYNLKRILIKNPSNLTLPAKVFLGCNKLERVDILGHCATVTANALGDGPLTRKNLTIRFKGNTAVPSLTGTLTQYSFSKELKIVVPDALYNDWIAATNWSAYAANIVKESEA